MSDPSRADVLLYVDDDPVSRRVLSLLFRQAGFAVREAATGDEALRLVEDKPDLVILDVNLPDINGIEVCRRIKAHPATASIPVLHLSAHFIRSEDKVHALDTGADGYLTKPVEPEEVIAQARALLRIHRAEEQARAAAHQWQATFDAISDGVCLLDVQGRALRCNQALGRLLGRSSAHLLGKTWYELTPWPPGSETGAPFPRMVASRRCESGELELGERRFEISADPLIRPDGALAGAVYIVHDITERCRLEERMRQAESMETVGRLAGGIAHDFNNLLLAVTGNAALVLAATPPEDSRHEPLLRVEKAAWRAAELVRQLLEFARLTAPRLKPTRLGECLHEVVDILRPTLGPRIVVEVRCPLDLLEAEVDADQIHRVLMNLCLNSRDAMPQGGRLLLEAENTVVDAAAAQRHPLARPGEFVRLSVRDTGEGISPEVLPHIFEPFYTTKPPGQGTGLGLATVYGIVRQHRGWVECTSTVGHGACFDVYLPRAQQPGG